MLNLILLLIIGIIIFFYFNQEKTCIELLVKNNQLKIQNKELINYKNDVSKTFQILNTELITINEKLKNNSTSSIQNNTTDLNTLLTRLNGINEIPINDLLYTLDQKG